MFSIWSNSSVFQLDKSVNFVTDVARQITTITSVF